MECDKLARVILAITLPKSGQALALVANLFPECTMVYNGALEMDEQTALDPWNHPLLPSHSSMADWVVHFSVLVKYFFDVS